MSRFILLCQHALMIATMVIASVQAHAAVGDGYWHTDGNKILDANNNEVRIAGLNWFGFETNVYCLHGLWQRDYHALLDQIKSLNYNTLRIPFCNQLFDPGSSPNAGQIGPNSDLAGLTGFQIMDKIIAYAGSIGLKVILDRHRPGSEGQSSLWYTDKNSNDSKASDPGYGYQCSEQRWIDDWKMLARHYLGNRTIIGADLHNEPHSKATWGNGVIGTDWRLAAERAGNAILAVNPNWLIMVEGIENYNGDSYWWGGNLKGAGAHPVRLNIANRLVYSVHEYPASVSNQPWFSAPNYPDNMSGVFESHWGYLRTGNIAPVWIGEFGTKMITTSDKQWLDAIIAYMGTTTAQGHHGVSWTFWCWNENSVDTGGILLADWTNINTAKNAKLDPIKAPFANPIATVATPTFNPLGGSITAAQSVTLSDSTVGAQIRFTTDGSTPNASSPLYTTPIAVTATTTIKALANKAGMTDSSIATSTYTITFVQTASTPTFNPAGGSFTTAPIVTLSDSTAGAQIRYTTDGSIPNAGSTLYSDPISMTTTTTIKAIAFKSGMNNSGIASATYTITFVSTVSTPSFSPLGGSFTTAQSVTLSDATAGAQIRYTSDGSTPNASSTLYTAPIAISATTTIKAIAIKAGMNNSTVASAIFTIAPDTSGGGSGNQDHGGSGSGCGLGGGVAALILTLALSLRLRLRSLI